MKLIVNTTHTLTAPLSVGWHEILKWKSCCYIISMHSYMTYLYVPCHLTEWQAKRARCELWLLARDKNEIHGHTHAINSDYVNVNGLPAEVTRFLFDKSKRKQRREKRTMFLERAPSRKDWRRQQEQKRCKRVLLVDHMYFRQYFSVRNMRGWRWNTKLECAVIESICNVLYFTVYT